MTPRETMQLFEVALTLETANKLQEVAEGADRPISFIMASAIENHVDEVLEYRRGCEEDVQDRPQAGDYILYPTGPLGSQTGVNIYEGNPFGLFSSNGIALAAIRLQMTCDNHYPSVWEMDDHGGFRLINLDEE